MNNLKEKNISIVFTCYNILEYLQLAIYSFLEQYPNYKNSIIVFDDQSDDGTTTWLKQNNIKSITWSNTNNYVVQFKKLKNLFPKSDTGLNASYRNSCMIKDIFNQVTTKYLMLNDADVIFTQKGWLEQYDNLIDQYQYKVIAPFDRYYYKWNYMNSFMFEKFIQHKMGKYINLFKYDFDKRKEWCERLHFFHSIIDLEYFKEQNILFDDIHDKKFIELIYSNATLDTGSDFYWQILKNNILFYIIPEKDYFNNYSTNSIDYIPCLETQFKNLYVYHLRWISSYRRLMDDLGEKRILNPFALIKIKKDFQNNKLLYNYVKYIHEKYQTNYPKECLSI